MKKNTKKILSIMTVAGLSVSTLTSNIENLANAKEDITSIAELTNSADRLSTEVIENETGAVIRVSAHANIQNVKTTYAVDNTKSQVVSFGDLKAGEVREIQVNLEENSNTAKVLPKTSVVSDKVEFAKEVKGHKIKGNVTFTYDDGRVFPGGNEAGKPSIPSESNKPGTPSEPGQPNVPGDAPSVPAEELKVTRSVDMDGTELEVVEGEQPAKTGVVKFGTKEYTHEKTETKDGITTHYYKLVESQVPGDAPSVPMEELKVTRSVDMDGNELAVEEGTLEAKQGVVKFNNKEYTHEKTETADGITIHFYKLVEGQVPGDAPSVPAEELKVTRSVDLEGNELAVEEGTLEAKQGVVKFNNKEYTHEKTETANGITTHFYKLVEHQVPGDAPSVPMEELKVTRSVDMDGTELLVEEGTVDHKTGVVKFNDKEYIFEKTETVDGITTHFYKLVEHQVPGDAPSVPAEELKVTRSVDMDGAELEVVEGTQPAKTGVVKFGTKEYTHEKTETKDGITTHYYKLVESQVPGDAPSVPMEELKVTRSVDLEGTELLVEEGTQEHKVGEVDFSGKKYTYVRTETKDGITTHFYKKVEAQNPEFSGIDAGLPKNVKWTRTQLQKWGFGIGKITGDYKVDGDLGTFATEDELDAAYTKGRKALNEAKYNNQISDEDYDNAPKSMLNEIEPGPAGFSGRLYDKNQIGNDGTPMSTDEEDEG